MVVTAPEFVIGVGRKVGLYERKGGRSVDEGIFVGWEEGDDGVEE